MTRLLAMALTFGGALVLAQQGRGLLPDPAIAGSAILLGVAAAAIVRKKLDALAVIAGAAGALLHEVLATRHAPTLAACAFVLVSLEAAEIDRLHEARWLRHAAYAVAAAFASALVVRYAGSAPELVAASGAIAGLAVALASFDAASFDVPEVSPPPATIEAPTTSTHEAPAESAPESSQEGAPSIADA